MSGPRKRGLVAALIALIVGNSDALAQPVTSDATEVPVELTAADLDAFLGPLMAEQLEKNKVAGAVIAVVKDNAILFSKGYGYADVAAKTPITPDGTLVRPGSISKLLTAVAVMQLVEQGKLDLDRDVNDYIDFSIPTPPGGVSVTLRRLMTHRAGFEDQVKDLIIFDSTPQPLGEWLKDRQPKRLYPKGDVSSYSNYGVALAGYVVERVSGEPFAAYIDAYILQPLNMTRSSFQQPLPSELAARASKGYFRSDIAPLREYETIPAAPAGALAATAEDMTRFMRALLNGGELDGARILKSETLAEMLAPQVKHPAGEMGLQFVKFQFGGRDYFGHTGGTIVVFSNFIVLPEENFGLFVSFNTVASGRALLEMPRKIAERYFPMALPAPVAMTENERQAKAVEGVYQLSQRVDSSFLKTLALLGQVKITALSDGTLTQNSALGLGPELPPYVEFAPGVFRRPNGSMIAFAPNSDHGGMTMQVSPPAVEAHRVAWHENAQLIVPLVAASFLTLLLTLLAWPVMAYLSRRRAMPFSNEARDRKAFILIRVVAAVGVGVLGALIGIGMWIGQDASKLDGQLDLAFTVIFAGAWLATLAAPAAGVVAFQFWQNKTGSRWTRIHHSLMAASSLNLAWFFVTYHIAGTTLNY